MRNPSSQRDFASFCNVVVPISSLMARSACTLVHSRQTQNGLWRGSECRRFTHLSLKLKKFHNLDESLKRLIFGIKTAKLISMHVIRLAIRANKFATRTLLPAIFNLKVFIDWTWVYDSGDISVVHTNSPNLSGPKKFTLESGFKNMRFQK